MLQAQALVAEAGAAMHDIRARPALHYSISARKAASNLQPNRNNFRRRGNGGNEHHRKGRQELVHKFLCLLIMRATALQACCWECEHPLPIMERIACFNMLARSRGLRQ